MGQIATFSGPSASGNPHPAERLESWLQRVGLGISTRNPSTGKPELMLVAPPGFDVQKAQDQFEAAMAPASRAQLAKWLAALAAITISRQRDDLDHGLITTIYTERLANFPADIVEHVLLRQRWKFWPAIAELEDAAELLLSRRRAVARLLAEGRVRERTSKPRPDRTPATAEARQRILKEVGLDAMGNENEKGWKLVGQASVDAAQGAETGSKQEHR